MNDLAPLKEQTPTAAFGYVPPNNPLWLATKKHVFIMAGTRAGKGINLILPHLLRYQGSVFALDPKGENAKTTGRRREQLNEKTHYLDPFGISGKPQSRYNPLSRFTEENMAVESMALAEALIMAEKRDHWTAGGQQLLAGLILHVYTSPNIPPEQKDLPYVRRLLLGDCKGTIRDMIDNEGGDGQVFMVGKSFFETDDKELSGIISTAQRQTEILDIPQIAACLSASGEGEEVDFKDYHHSTMSVFLCLSAPKFPVFNRWLRLVLTAAMNEMTDILDPPVLPVCFLLDELQTLGHVKIVENAIGLAAGYGVQIWSVFQDLGALKELYKSRWPSFIGNAGVRVVFNLGDNDSADYWSKFAGMREVEKISSQQDTYGITSGQSVSSMMHPLITPDELMLNYAKDKMLVFTEGMHPIESWRVPYFIDQSLNGLWD